jgi:hypothetical protein
MIENKCDMVSYMELFVFYMKLNWIVANTNNFFTIPIIDIWFGGKLI